MDENQDIICLFRNRHLKVLLVGLAILIITSLSLSVTVDKHYESNPAPEWVTTITADIIRIRDDYDEDMYQRPAQPVIDHITPGSRMFNSSGLDTLVFVHIQKTGGSTIERRLVEDIGTVLLYFIILFILR